MDPQSPNKLIATKYCFLILGDDTSFFIFIFFFFFLLLLLLFYVIINLKKIYFIFLFSFLIFFYEFFLFFHVPGCSGMFRVLSKASFVSTCDVFNCLFPLDVQNEIQLLLNF